MSSRTMSGRIFLGLAQRLFAAGGGDHAEAFVVRVMRDELRDPRLVIGDEHERLSAHVSHSGPPTLGG